MTEKTSPTRPSIRKPINAIPPVVEPVAETGQFPDDGDASSEGLTPREILFVDALALGRTLGDAATAASISTRSGRRWKAKPQIVEAIRARMIENIAVGRAILAAGMSKAATGLVAMASGEAPAESARVSACRAVTEGVVKLCELDELQARLALLEDQRERERRDYENPFLNPLGQCVP